MAGCDEERGRLRWCHCVGQVALLMALSFPLGDTGHAYAEDSVDYLEQIGGGRLGLAGAAFLRENCVLASVPCKRVSAIGGWWWAAKYSDGPVVFNCFRKCRGSCDTALYVLGVNTDTDCHAWFGDAAGRRRQLCFPRDALALTKQHGPLLAIQRLKECWE